MAVDSKIYLLEDEWEEGKWRVEYFDKDGGCSPDRLQRSGRGTTTPLL